MKQLDQVIVCFRCSQEEKRALHVEAIKNGMSMRKLILSKFPEIFKEVEKKGEQICQQ